MAEYKDGEKNEERTNCHFNMLKSNTNRRPVLETRFESSLSRQNPLVEPANLNLFYFARQTRLTWSGSLLAYASENHKQNVNGSPKLIWGHY